MIPIYTLKFLFKFQSCVFIMGLLNIKYDSKIKTYFRKIFTKLFINLLDKLIFLSLGEYEYAKKNFPKYVSKFYFLPFSVDTDFGILTQRPLKKIKAFYLLVMMEKEITNL